MLNRNSDRLGPDPASQIQQNAESIPVQQITESKTDLGYFQPVELVDLPTKGKFYPEGHPLHNVESLEIRYMTTKDVEILNSKSLIQKGVALNKVLQGLMTNKNIKLDDMFVSDKNALVLAARITGFSAEYKTKIVCPSCAERTVHTFDLNKVHMKEADENVKIALDGTFDITLPKSKMKVTCKLLIGLDEKALQISSEKQKKHKLPETPIADQLKQMIVSVNGDVSREVVDKAVDSMLAIDSKFVRDEYARISPNIDLKQTFECQSCFDESEINIPFTSDFFWPQ